jgi:hypothetical protein
VVEQDHQLAQRDDPYRRNRARDHRQQNDEQLVICVRPGAMPAISSARR